MNQIFSWSRVGSFLRYKFELNYRTWLIQLGAFAGIFTLVSALFFLNAEPSFFKEYYNLFLVLTLFACGFYITSRSYSDLENVNRGFLFMQMPVSVFEKFIVPVFFSGLVFPFLFIVYFAFVGTVSNAFISLFYNFDPYVVSIWNTDYIGIVKAYITIQPFFLIGSIRFKKQHLLWSAVSIVSVILVFVLFWLITSKLAFGTLEHSGYVFGFDLNITSKGFTINDLVMLITVVTAWFITFFKLKEREV